MPAETLLFTLSTSPSACIDRNLWLIYAGFLFGIQDLSSRTEQGNISRATLGRSLSDLLIRQKYKWFRRVNGSGFSLERVGMDTFTHCGSSSRDSSKIIKAPLGYWPEYRCQCLGDDRKGANACVCTRTLSTSISLANIRFRPQHLTSDLRITSVKSAALCKAATDLRLLATF